jgi:acetylglutamate kinase
MQIFHRSRKLSGDATTTTGPANGEGEVLMKALTKLKVLAHETVVVKYGGHAMGEPEARASFAKDVALLQAANIKVVVVHGGGPMIADLLKRLDLPSKFVDGMRVTDQATVEVAEMVLSGLLNKRTVHEIGIAGGSAIGLSGKDNNLILCTQLNPALGLVGEPVTVNAQMLCNFLANDIMPVIAPIGQGFPGDTNTYNINADVAASVVAKALRASRLLLLTDVAGVLDKEKKLLPELTSADIKRLVADGTISGGMIPKVNMALDAAEGGVGKAVILDGRIPHAVLLNLLGEQSAGTSITV